MLLMDIITDNTVRNWETLDWFKEAIYWKRSGDNGITLLHNNTIPKHNKDDTRGAPEV